MYILYTQLDDLCQCHTVACIIEIVDFALDHKVGRFWDFLSCSSGSRASSS